MDTKKEEIKGSGFDKKHLCRDIASKFSSKNQEINGISNTGSTSSSSNSGISAEANTLYCFHRMFDNLRKIKFKDEEFGWIEKPQENRLYYTDSMSRVKKEIKSWLEHKKWFKDRNLKWKRGALIYGVPGTGKSALIEDICLDLRLPLVTFDLSTYDNKDFSEDWRDKVPFGSVVLFEDFDALYEGRESVFSKTRANYLTFDCILNCIAGVNDKDGIFIVVTTNYPDKIDEALKRPGRLDLQIELTALPRGGRLFIARKILKDWPALIEKLVDENEGKTAAEFENICISLAVDKFWREKV